jgi:hypothetical protein
MNVSIYASLSQINQALQQVEEHVQHLKDAKVIKDKSSQGWQIRAAELRAEINYAVTVALGEKEAREWGHFGKLRIKLEKTVQRTRHNTR